MEPPRPTERTVEFTFVVVVLAVQTLRSSVLGAGWRAVAFRRRFVKCVGAGISICNDVCVCYSKPEMIDFYKRRQFHIIIIIIINRGTPTFLLSCYQTTISHIGSTLHLPFISERGEEHTTVTSAQDFYDTCD